MLVTAAEGRAQGQAYWAPEQKSPELSGLWCSWIQVGAVFRPTQGSVLRALASPSFVLVSFSRKKPVSWEQEAPVAFSPHSTSLEKTEGSISPRGSSYRWGVFVLGPVPTSELIMEARRMGCSSWPDKSCACHTGAVSPTGEPRRPRGAVCGKGRSHWMPKT